MSERKDLQNPIVAKGVAQFLGVTSDWLPLLLTCSIALSTTTGVGIGASWFDEQRILWLIVLGATSLFTLPRVPSSSACLVVSAALLIGLLSSFLASRPYPALVDWSVYCLMATLTLASSPRIGARDLRLAVALAVTVLATAYTAGVVSNYLSALFLGFPVGAETLLVGFSNPRFPAQLQALTIPLLPLAMRVAPKGFWRCALYLVASLWWMCLIGSGSRTAWIGLLAAALLILALGRVGQRWVVVQCTLVFSGLCLWLVLFVALPWLIGVPTQIESGRLSDLASAGTRWSLWQLCIDMMRAHPLLGVGPMHFAYSYNGIAAHPHNFWLQLAAEWGTLAAILAVSAVLAFFVRLVTTTHRCTELFHQDIGVALVGATIAWGIGTLTDGNMVVPTSQAMSVVVLTFGVMWLRSLHPFVDSKGTVAVVSGWVLRLLAVAAILTIASLPFTRFGSPTEREAAWRTENPGALFLPRFWQQGWIGPDHDPSSHP